MSYKLFSEIPWSDFALEQHKKIEAEVRNQDESRLLETPTVDLGTYFITKYGLNVPVLHRDAIVMDRSEPGKPLTVRVPFEGNRYAFDLRPSRYSMTTLRGSVSNTHVELTFPTAHIPIETLKAHIEQTLAGIETALTRLRADAENLNEQLRTSVRRAIETRKAEVLARGNLADALGFKAAPHPNDPKTFAAPELQRLPGSARLELGLNAGNATLQRGLKEESSSNTCPEPIMTDADFEHIISVLKNMALVMERAPSAFSDQDEESLRQHFLVQLNGHYEGQASGETFNYLGKTDILVRSGGKNVFIAECKFWEGYEALTEALDQILSYSSWRDTKVALIIFNRKKNFTHTLQGIRDGVFRHPQLKKELKKKSETDFRYIFKHRDDPQREMYLAVLAFDVPTMETALEKIMRDLPPQSQSDR